MKLRVYAVLDKAVQAYLTPLCFRSHGEAMRSFGDAVLNRDSVFFKHKEDYAFCFIGWYDDSLGQFVDCTAPAVVCEAATVSLNGFEAAD
ncbi:nonstructural protein [robinz microvirus RP_102]|nr:nonstructural protein [robinz microvirus RP_102]